MSGWLRLDAALPTNPKWVTLSDHAKVAYITALCVAKQRNDPTFASGKHLAVCIYGYADALDELTEVGLIEVTEEGGFILHDWSDYQTTMPDPVAAGKARAASAGRAAGRFTSGRAPADTSGTPAVPLVEATSETETETETTSVGSSLRSSPTATAAPPRSDSEWVEYVVAPKANRAGRLSEYWAERFGAPLGQPGVARLAGLLKEHPGGAEGLMADIAATALRGAKGDPLDFITAKMGRRSGNAGRPTPANAGLSGGTDRDAYVVSG